MNLCLAVSGDMTIILAASRAVLPAKALNAGLSGEIILFWITFQMEDVSRMSCFQTTAQQIQFSHFVGFCVTKPALHCVLCSIMLNGPQALHYTVQANARHCVMFHVGVVYTIPLLIPLSPVVSYMLSLLFYPKNIPFYLCQIVYN